MWKFVNQYTFQIHYSRRKNHRKPHRVSVQIELRSSFKSFNYVVV